MPFVPKKEEKQDKKAQKEETNDKKVPPNNGKSSTVTKEYDFGTSSGKKTETKVSDQKEKTKKVKLKRDSKAGYS